MKRLATILFAVIAIALTATAQIVQPIKWTGAVEGDSVKLTATIEDGTSTSLNWATDSTWMNTKVRSPKP